MSSSDRPVPPVRRDRLRETTLPPEEARAPTIVRSRSRTGRRARDEEKEEIVLLTRGLWRRPQHDTPGPDNRGDAPLEPSAPVGGVSGARVPVSTPAPPPRVAARGIDESTVVVAGVVAAACLGVIGLVLTLALPPL